jgi:hypothetical protein
MRCLVLGAWCLVLCGVLCGVPHVSGACASLADQALSAWHPSPSTWRHSAQHPASGGTQHLAQRPAFGGTQHLAQHQARSTQHPAPLPV